LEKAMYKKILVALENGPADRTLLPHVADLALRLGSELLLVHVADGWVARNYDALKLADSDEMKSDRRYLDEETLTLRERGVRVEFKLAMGDPATEIVKWAKAEHCDLIAMTTHGHKFVGDIVHGSTIEPVRHNSPMPLLVIPTAEAVEKLK
jgi:nucleotide-binding universal stress UspA family protein